MQHNRHRDFEWPQLSPLHHAVNTVMAHAVFGIHLHNNLASSPGRSHLFNVARATLKRREWPGNEANNNYENSTVTCCA